MLDPDIQGRLESLDREHLAAVFDYMLGNAASDSRESAMRDETVPLHDPETTTPDLGRGKDVSHASQN